MATMWLAAVALGLASHAGPALLHVPVRLAEMLYARLSVRLTLADGGRGRYGLVWGVWRRARLTPGLGYYQPDFQCAEYVMRSLRAAGYGIATPPASSAGWVDLVNVDRALSYLESRGIGRPAPLDRLGVGDAVFFHYLRNGADNWSHVALVQRVHPLRLAAHDRDRWSAPLATYPPYQAIMGLKTLPSPHPPAGRTPLGGVRWGEVSLRDPPLRTKPAGTAGRRLYLGQLVRLEQVARAPGSWSGWLSVRSGPLAGWLNGDAVTRLSQAPPAVGPRVTLLGLGRARTTPVPVAVRGAWGRNLYVDADDCPTPAWLGAGCTAPFVHLPRPHYPAFTVVAQRPVHLSLNPDPASLVVATLKPNTAVPAERMGAYAVLFAPGGPRVGGGVLYAPAKLLNWRRGGVFLFLRPVRAGALRIPPNTAAAVWGHRLVSLFASYPDALTGLDCPAWRPGRPVPAGTAGRPPVCLYVPAGAAKAPARTPSAR